LPGSYAVTVPVIVPSFEEDWDWLVADRLVVVDWLVDWLPEDGLLVDWPEDIASGDWLDESIEDEGDVADEDDGDVDCDEYEDDDWL